MIVWTLMIKLTTAPSALRKEGIRGVLTQGVYHQHSNQSPTDLNSLMVSDRTIHTSLDWELGQ